MYLLIDAGNTRIKWLLMDSVYDNSALVSYGDLEEFKAYVARLDVYGIKVVLAAVNQTDTLINLLHKVGFKQIEIASSRAEQLGVINSYAQPERMGVDRWLAMVAAYSAVNKNTASGVIVVDAGSALTVDVVDIAGKHLGGYIVPGLMMAQRALFSNTERVIPYESSSPGSELTTPFNILGNNTLQCVEYGVINQLVALVQSVVGRYPGYEVVFTGGDGELIANFFTPTKIDKNLVLKGLWQVRN